ncbi:MAG: hypothetical protein HZB14_07650 [Actinobacteria bacterium]|nr:hypothetical protein [Actinomycetota bacterium]
MKRTALFAREQLRTPFTLALLVAIPALFVISSAGVLSDFAAVLGGSLDGDSAAALGAGWAAAFLSGALGYFEAVSSSGADRRLALAGAGPSGVAVSRLLASLLLAGIAAASAYVALVFQIEIVHPLHVAVGVAGFAVIYLSVGVLIGSVIQSPLEGSLAVVFVFLLDAFSGPGMAGSVPFWAVSQSAADVLIAAGAGSSSSESDIVELLVVAAGSVLISLAVFTFMARRRS